MFDPWKIRREEISESRRAALLKGKTFYRGKPCQRDPYHVHKTRGTTTRYTSNRACRSCQLLATLDGSRDYRAERGKAEARKAGIPLDSEVSYTRAAARKKGKRFYKGKACHNPAHVTGGKSIRYTSSSACQACLLDYRREGRRDYKAERARARANKEARNELRQAAADKPDLFGDLI